MVTLNIRITSGTLFDCEYYIQPTSPTCIMDVCIEFVISLKYKYYLKIQSGQRTLSLSLKITTESFSCPYLSILLLIYTGNYLTISIFSYLKQ